MKKVFLCLLLLPISAGGQLPAEAAHSAVMTHFLCSAPAVAETFDESVGAGKGRVVYDEALKCMDEKLPAALTEAGKNAELRAAIKAWHAKEITLLRSPTDRAVEKDVREARSTLEMEAKSAGVWR